MARKMKDSGIEWIGEIPEGWEVCRLKNIVACHDELRKPISADKRENHLKLYNYYGASGVIDTIDDYNVDGTVLLIGEDGANLKLRNLPLIYRASGKFWVNNHAHILVVNKKHSYDYVAYLLEAGDYSNYITGSAQPKLSQFNLMRFPVAIPNYAEQENISFFINRDCSKIDSMLSKTRSSIEEYKKLKQAVITQAVTKGVRGEREMKDSGVEWIGEINHRFSLIKLKYICSILDQYRKPISADKRSQSGSVLYDYYGASGAIDKIDDYTIDDHVMLIGEDGANLRMRNLPLMYEVNGKAWINNHAHILKPTERVDFYYLFYALEGLDINPYITGSAQPKLSQEKLQNIWVPLPSLEEQQEIATYIRSKCAEIDGLIAKKEQLVKELESYKKSLIYEVVTGKREV